MPPYRSASGSAAEDLFIDLFSDTFGAEKAGYLYSQYPFFDIYQNARFADFVLENGGSRIAIEIDDEASHNPRLVSHDKFYDDLLKQNSMIHLGWDVCRWAVRQMQRQPDAVVDYPVDATDYELVDVFNWQEEAAGMISQMEFVRRVDVQTETIERYVREGKLIPDLIVPMSEHRTFKYFKEETLEAYAAQYGWRLIDDDNRKQLFLEMAAQMDMSYSYKPVLLKAILRHADAKGRVKLDDIVDYFRSFYEARRGAGQIVEKPNSIFAKGGYTDRDAQRNILANPFKRFEDMNMMRHTKTLGIVEVEPSVWKHLTSDEKDAIVQICDRKLAEYYDRLDRKAAPGK